MPLQWKAMSDATEFRNEFQSVLGYYELGMWDDALAEIAIIERELKAEASAEEPLPQVELDELRLVVFQGAKRWAAMRQLAEACAEAEPARASWFISWAFALRREESIPAARRILQRAVLLHPDEALISFNLACYAAQLGELDEARQRLDRAVALDPALKKNAQDDPDLEPMRRAPAV